MALITLPISAFNLAVSNGAEPASATFPDPFCPEEALAVSPAPAGCADPAEEAPAVEVPDFGAGRQVHPVNSDANKIA